MTGDTSDYHGDESAADQALCNLLVFWTNKDAVQMDRLFRSFGLMRGKWDERRGEKTYGQKTIEESCAYVTETYAGSRHRHRYGIVAAKSNGHANGNGHRGRATIILGVDEFRVNDEAIDALSDHAAVPEIYQRGNVLVRVLRVRIAGRSRRPSHRHAEHLDNSALAPLRDHDARCGLRESGFHEGGGRVGPGASP